MSTDRDICKKNHRYYPEFSLVPDFQGQSDDNENICCGCAYQRGVSLGLEMKHSELMPSEIFYSTIGKELPSAYCGTVYNKDPYTAFAQGFLRGRELNS